MYLHTFIWYTIIRDPSPPPLHSTDISPSASLLPPKIGVVKVRVVSSPPHMLHLPHIPLLTCSTPHTQHIPPTHPPPSPVCYSEGRGNISRCVLRSPVSTIRHTSQGRAYLSVLVVKLEETVCLLPPHPTRPSCWLSIVKWRSMNCSSVDGVVAWRRRFR